MTCIVGLVTPNGAWIGSDSFNGNDDVYSLTTTPKIGKFGSLLIGYAGSWKVGRLAFQLLSAMPNPNVKNLCHQLETKERNWYILVIEGQRIYQIDDDITPIKVKATNGVSYAAIGAEAAALGSLYANHSGRESVLTALKAAEAHSLQCRRPFSILSL